jgi:hypothetical protein
MSHVASGTRLTLTVLFCAVLSALTGCDNRSGTQFSRDLEEARVTSPTGGLDAILIRADAGLDFEYYVYIVARGNRVSTNDHPIFEAGTLTGGALVWSHPHLLDIRYDIANIDLFRNYWDSSSLRTDREEHDDDFGVEIRLVPSSPDYSLLSPNGKFKSIQ